MVRGMGAVPKYRHVMDYLSEQISNGSLSPGDKLENEDVYARRFGVSGITVRRALNELVAKGDINRVKGKGSFVSDASGKSENLLFGLMMSVPQKQDDSFYTKVMMGVHNAILSKGDYLLVEFCDWDGSNESNAAQRLLKQNVNGLLVLPSDPARNKGFYGSLKSQNVPYVMIDRYDFADPCNYAGADNFNGAVTAARALMSNGHAGIRFVGDNFKLSSEQERFAGYLYAMKNAGLEVDGAGPSAAVDYDAIVGEAKQGKTTALLCANDSMAERALRELAGRGARIPDDISVIGFDDLTTMKDPETGLSTIRLDFRTIGENAANLLRQIVTSRRNGINGAVYDNVNVTYTKNLSGYELVMRGTVCPPKRG